MIKGRPCCPWAGLSHGIGHTPMIKPAQRWKRVIRRGTRSTVLIDLDSVVETSSVTLLCALRAANQLWPDVPSQQHHLQTVDLSQISLSCPEDAVFLVKLLQDELVLGPQQRASGTRRTRPFRLAEISALWGEELLSVCLARWALSAKRSTASLRDDARAAWQASLLTYAHEDHTSTLRRQAVGAQEESWAPHLPGGLGRGGLSQESGSGREDMPTQPRPFHQVVNMLLAARAEHRVCVVSVWPADITSALLRQCGLHTGEVQPWDPHGSAPGLFQVTGETWEAAATAALGLGLTGSPASPPQLPYLVTANSARAEQALDLCRGAAQVLLADWGSIAPGVRARASAKQLRLVDDVGMAGLLSVTDSRLVMDGIVW